VPSMDDIDEALCGLNEGARLQIAAPIIAPVASVDVFAQVHAPARRTSYIRLYGP
jgi:hypothetical protein